MISEALQAACDNAIRSSRRGDTRSSIGLARHAYRLARQESPKAELEALNALALCQAANGSYIESIATSIDTISLARQHSQRCAAAYALTTMAGSASFILDVDNVVIEMLKVCRSEADALDEIPLKVRIHNTFGLVYGNLARFDDGDREYDQGIALVTEAKGRAAMITPGYLMVGNKAFLSVLRAKAASAMATLAAADFPGLVEDAERRIQYFMGIATAEMNSEAESRAFFSLGQLRALQGNNLKALSAFGEALARATQIRHNPRWIDTNIEISKLHAAGAQFESALQALEEAYEIADANRPTGKVVTACEGMAKMYASLGRSREAAHYDAKTERERESFDRENEHAARDLNAFWRTIASDHPKPLT